MFRPVLIIGILCGLLLGCQGPHPAGRAGNTAAGSANPTIATPGDPPSSSSANSIADPAATPPAADKPVALLAGRPVHWADLRQGMIEAQGGIILAEVILDRLINQRLAEAGIRLTPADIDNEKTILAQSLATDPDQAQRLIDDLRQSRGLGEVRYARFLARNAGLRRLVQDKVNVNDAAVSQAFAMVYGPRYQGRVVMVETLTEAGEVVRRGRAGESFIDLAIDKSTDSSRAQGGLLPPVSPLDPTFPAAVRAALTKLQPGQIGDPVSLENGFAVLKLERIIPAQDVKLADVKADLTLRVRRQAEQMLMRQTAKAMLDESAKQLIIFDPALSKSWQQQAKQMGE